MSTHPDSHLEAVRRTPVEQRASARPPIQAAIAPVTPRACGSGVHDAVDATGGACGVKVTHKGVDFDLDVDPNMVSHPRQSSYIRMDGWDEEAEKWFERKMEEAAA